MIDLKFRKKFTFNFPFSSFCLVLAKISIMPIVSQLWRFSPHCSTVIWRDQTVILNFSISLYLDDGFSGIFKRSACLPQSFKVSQVLHAWPPTALPMFLWTSKQNPSSLPTPLSFSLKKVLWQQPPRLNCPDSRTHDRHNIFWLWSPPPTSFLSAQPVSRKLSVLIQCGRQQPDDRADISRFVDANKWTRVRFWIKKQTFLSKYFTLFACLPEQSFRFATNQHIVPLQACLLVIRVFIFACPKCSNRLKWRHVCLPSSLFVNEWLFPNLIGFAFDYANQFWSKIVFWFSFIELLLISLLRAFNQMIVSSKNGLTPSRRKFVWILSSHFFYVHFSDAFLWLFIFKTPTHLKSQSAHCQSKNATSCTQPPPYPTGNTCRHGCECERNRFHYLPDSSRPIKSWSA